MSDGYIHWPLAALPRGFLVETSRSNPARTGLVRVIPGATEQGLRELNFTGDANDFTWSFTSIESLKFYWFQHKLTYIGFELPIQQHHHQ